MKKGLYLVLIVLLCYSFYQKIKLNDLVDKTNSIIKQNVMNGYYREIAKKERFFLKQNFYNIEFVNSNGEKFVPDKVLKSYHIYLITSIDKCSSCREYLLNMWQKFYSEIPDLPLTIIFSEQKPLERMQLVRYKAYLRGGAFTMPFICDAEGVLATEDNNGLPTIVIVDNDNQVIAVNIVDDNFNQKNLAFNNFALNLVNKKRRFAYND